MSQEWITQAARNFASRHVFECELQEKGLPIPVIWMEDELIHTDDHPFCGDPQCPCKNVASYDQLVKRPMRDGLLTNDESISLYWGENV